MFLLFVVAVVISIQRRETTKENYRSALARYRNDPPDQGLRQVALEAGRQYSQSTRNSYGNAYFDEAAIRNDLDVIAEAAPIKAEPLKTTIEGRLQTLEGLFTKGFITEDEYQSRRSAILDEV